MTNGAETPGNGSAGSMGGLVAALADSGGLLSQVIGKEAAKALSSVIGSALKVPDAYFSSIAKGVMADAEAKAHIKKQLAAEVGRRALTDEGLLDRMATRWLGDELKKQINREAVAVEAAEDLRSDPPQADKSVDEDFLDRLGSYAENATSERMQKLFGRVLAGEIRTPGTYSLAALNALSLMDQRVAQAVEKAAHWVIGDFIPGDGPFAAGATFGTKSVLEEAGLCYAPASRMRKVKAVNGQVVLAANDKDGAPVFHILTDSPEVSLSITPLTSMGRQIMGLVATTYTDDVLRHVAEGLLATTGAKAVELGTAITVDGALVSRRVGPFDPPVAI